MRARRLLNHRPLATWHLSRRKAPVRALPGVPSEMFRRSPDDLVQPFMRGVAVLAFVPKQADLKRGRRIGQLVNRNRVCTREGVGQGARYDRGERGALKQRRQRKKVRHRNCDPWWAFAVDERLFQGGSIKHLRSSREAALGQKSVDRAFLLATEGDDGDWETGELFPVKRPEFALRAGHEHVVIRKKRARTQA